MKTVLLIVSLSACIFSSCQEKKENIDVERRKGIGKYLYLSADKVLHIDKDCIGIFHIIDEDGAIVRTYGISFIDTMYIVSDSAYSYCRRCFNNKLYEQVQDMIRQNRVDNNKNDLLQFCDDSKYSNK